MIKKHKPVFAIGLGFRDQGYIRFEKAFCQREANGDDKGNVEAVQNFLLIAEKMLGYGGGNKNISLKDADIKGLKQVFGANNHGGTVDFLNACKGKKKKAVIVVMADKQPSKGCLEESCLVLEMFSNGQFSALNENHRHAMTQIFGGLPTVPMSAAGVFKAHMEAHDKIPSWLLFRNPGSNRFVPLSFARDGACIGERNTFMYGAHVNMGVRIGDDNLLDGSCSIASCVQLGNRNKIGSFVSMEGVLSPVNEKPVIVGDDNFFGTRCRIGTGLVIGNKNFWGSGVDISKGTPLRDLRKGSSTYHQYVKAGDKAGIQGSDEMMITINRSRRRIGSLFVYPGEFLLNNNSEENKARFERNDDLNANN